jgi:hypothetical protein
MPKGVLSDSIIVAVSQMVDDAQSARRDPSHNELDQEVKKFGLFNGDPKAQGQQVGKAKRVRGILNWAIENDLNSGSEFVGSLIAIIRGHGGFRESSPNFVGKDAIASSVSAFAAEGYDLTEEGELRPRLLESLSGIALTDALSAYVRRAKLGSADAALVTGTGKDLLEAVAGHILQQKYGGYSPTSNFPTLLGQVFVALELATPNDAIVPGEPPNRRIERAIYELACGINQLRNKQGTGHGRPWLPTVTESEAKMAIEAIGIIAERLLAIQRGAR